MVDLNIFVRHRTRQRRGRTTRDWLAGVALMLGFWASTSAAAQAPDWGERLESDFAKIDALGDGRIGVYVRDMNSGTEAAFKADQRWYLASTVKVPVAIAVLRAVENKRYTLDSKVTLRASDYVDGAGKTNTHPVGKALSIRFLLDQMIIYSDNTATDMLIGLVGLDEVNALVESLVPVGFRPITTLGEVRRQVYGQLAPGAERLSGQDLLVLHKLPSDAERVALFSTRVNVPAARFKLPSLDAAYNAYYAAGLNSGRLDAYGELLAQLAEGKALTPRYTDYLLKVMERVATGRQRIKAGLPMEARFAHKTGTQRRRICDSGIVRFSGDGSERRVIIVACARDHSSLARSELALKQVGAAICRSGLLTRGIIDAPVCETVPVVGRLPAAALR